MASAPDLNASDSDDELHTCNSQCDHTDAPSIAPNLETYDLNAQQPVIADHELTDDWEKDSEEYRTYVEACKEIYCHFDSKPYNQKHIFIKNPVHMFVTKSHGAANLLWSVHPLQLPGLL
jgi:aspartate/tyrosine/aromatic aminotransferase